MNDNLSIFGKTYTGVTAITLTDTNNQQQKFINTADANATINDMLSGKTAYVNGSKVTGNILSQGAQTITPGTTNQTIVAGKYLTGAQTIAGDSNLVAENIAEGITIFGVVGTHTGGTSYPEAAGNYFGTNLISFTVQYVGDYNAMPGMTWSDFINSKYNYDHFFIDPYGYILISNNVMLYDSHHSRTIDKDELIISDGIYGSGSPGSIN